MKFSDFFGSGKSRSDIEREAQQELEALMGQAQPPSDSDRTWVLPSQEVPDFRAAPPPPPAPRPARRRVIRPLIPPMGSQGRQRQSAAEPDLGPDFPFGVEFEGPVEGRPFEDNDVPFEDDTPLDQVPIHEVFEERPSRRAAAPRTPEPPVARDPWAAQMAPPAQPAPAPPAPEPDPAPRAAAPRPRPARPRPPAAGGDAETARPRQPQKRTPPPRRRPPE